MLALVVAQSLRISDLIEQLILIESESLNGIIRHFIIKANATIKTALKENDEELVRLMGVMGEPEEALEDAEESGQELDPYFPPIVRSSAAYPRIPLDPALAENSSNSYLPKPRVISINHSVNGLQDDDQGLNNSRSAISDSANIRVSQT